MSTTSTKEHIHPMNKYQSKTWIVFCSYYIQLYCINDSTLSNNHHKSVISLFQCEKNQMTRGDNLKTPAYSFNI